MRWGDDEVDRSHLLHVDRDMVWIGTWRRWKSCPGRERGGLVGTKVISPE